jgi:hypothetical protein
VLTRCGVVHGNQKLSPCLLTEYIPALVTRHPRHATKPAGTRECLEQEVNVRVDEMRHRNFINIQASQFVIYGETLQPTVSHDCNDQRPK